MDLRTIKKLQKMYGIKPMQDAINDGSAWYLEGSIGRSAMRTLELGLTLLPKKSFLDYYGSQIPSRDMLKKGSMGTKDNCIKYWSNFDEDKFHSDLGIW